MVSESEPAGPELVLVPAEVEFESEPAAQLAALVPQVVESAPGLQRQTRVQPKWI